jgi:ferritin-like metal-binding protein YciE
MLCIPERSGIVRRTIVALALPIHGHTTTTTMAKQNNAPKGLQKLLEDSMADIYYAEKQILKALPKMAKAAENEDLAEGFRTHLEETKEQVSRLEEAFAALGKPAKGKKCPAIDGILEEGTEIMDEFKGDPALDAGLVAAAQKVEHYEITSYGSMVAWAAQLGHDDVAELLQATLDEEKATDEKLTEVAETVVNIEAEEEEDDDEPASNTTAKKAAGKKAAKKAAPMKKEMSFARNGSSTKR